MRYPNPSGSESCWAPFAKQVGRPILFTDLFNLVSFLPVFLLESQEGRMFRPLAYTKSFAIAFSSVLAITVVPVLMVLFIRGERLRLKKTTQSRGSSRPFICR